MQYDKSFFVNRRELTLVSANKILDILWDHFKPNSVLDVGCATGIWLAECERKGAKNILGIDGPWVPKEEMEIDRAKFIEHKLENITIHVEKYDLALCIELAEHLPEDSGKNLIKFLTSHADIILFSAAVPGQGGTGHVNERIQSYWHKQFSDLKFECFDLIRPSIWNDATVNVIYKQNMLLYVRTNSGAHDALKRCKKNFQHTSSNYELDRIHPHLLWLRSPSKKQKKHFLKRIFGSNPN